MRGQTSAEYLFDAEIERTLRARRRGAKQARLAKEEDRNSTHSGSESEDEPMNPPQERLLGDYGGTNAPGGRMTIVNQPVNVPNFQLHPSTITQLEKRSFSGRVNEDANKHLQRFLTMSTTLKIDGHTEEQKKLRMFPFTLADEAEEWFYSLPAGSITSWEDMETAFLKEYFLASVFMRKRYEILNFKQKEGESLGDSFKRLKRLLVACPTHRIKTKQLIDTAAGGSSNFSTATGIKKIIEAIAANEHLELYDKVTSKPEGVIDLKLEVNKQLKIEEAIAAEVEKKLKAMNMGTQQVAQVKNVVCDICSGPHMTAQCIASPKQIEEIKFLRQNNPYSNTYNPGWKNHPNFAWKDQQQQAPQKEEWEVAIEKMAAHTSQFQEETRSNHRNTTAAIKNLEVQMGQIAQQVAMQAQGNQKNHENVNVVTTRSENVANEREDEVKVDDELIEVELEVRENKEKKGRSGATCETS